MSKDIFGETLRFLNRVGSTYTYHMDILPDKDGYIDRACHRSECMSWFKVNKEDWKRLFKDEAVYCPFCGNSAPSDEWNTQEQQKQLEDQAVRQFTAELNRAIQNDVRRFNRSQSKDGFLSMSMSFNGKTTFVNLPAKALEEMEQHIQCDKCGARYAVIGSAFYCPCCGMNSARQIFSNTIALVRAKTINIPAIRNDLSKRDKDNAARICRSLLESSISDLVVALQKLCEAVYPTIPGAVATKGNVFQRIDESDRLWKSVCGYGYSDWLSADEYSLLKKYFQQRHVLQHNDGIVDQDYVNKSGDTSYQIGQRLIIREADINVFADIVEKIGNQILALA